MSDLTEREWLEALKPNLMSQWQLADAAQERLWHAETLVDELRTKLAVAEAALERARRDHEKQGGLLKEVWGFFRQELERIPVIPQSEVSP